jgi:hypothetical protein
MLEITGASPSIFLEFTRWNKVEILILTDHTTYKVRTKYYENMRPNKYKESPKTNLGESSLGHRCQVRVVKPGYGYLCQIRIVKPG